MSLVDEHKEDVSEASYVHMCNALKYLHDRFAAQAHPPPPPTRPHPGMTNQNRVPHQQPVRESPIEFRISTLEHQILRLERQIRETGRVINEDKVRTLESLLQSHSIALPAQGALYSNTRVNELKALISQHSEMFRGIDLMRAFQERRNERMERDRSVLRNRIEQLRSEISMLRNVYAP